MFPTKIKGELMNELKSIIQDMKQQMPHAFLKLFFLAVVYKSCEYGSIWYIPYDHRHPKQSLSDCEFCDFIYFGSMFKHGNVSVY